jgi:mycothiol synthase
MILSDLSNLPPVDLPEGCDCKTLESGLSEEFLRVLNRAYKRKEVKKNFLQCLGKDPDFDPRNFILIRSGGKPLAVAVAGQRKGKGKFKGEKIGFLDNVGVDPDFRRQGLGRMISLLALHRHQERGFKYVILTSNDFRLPAIRLYLMLGFRPLCLHLGDRCRWKYVTRRLEKMG